MTHSAHLGIDLEKFRATLHWEASQKGETSREFKDHTLKAMLNIDNEMVKDARRRIATWRKKTQPTNQRARHVNT